MAKTSGGQVYCHGYTLRTNVPPAAMPHQGRDNYYDIIDGVPEQLSVTAVAPGDTDYHGGKWAYHRVTWNVEPYLLTSEEEVLAAELAGDVTITRESGNDFKAPLQK
jgi:hypothetical protein